MLSCPVTYRKQQNIQLSTVGNVVSKMRSKKANICSLISKEGEREREREREKRKAKMRERGLSELEKICS